MRFFRGLFLGTVLALTIAGPSPVLAATAQDQKPDPVLRQLYLTELQAETPDAAIQARILTERARVKKQELEELNALVDAANEAEKEKTESVTTALENQAALVDTLQVRKQETVVDLDLLSEDEAALDENALTAQGAALEGVQRRKAELLSRKAVLEERLSAVDEILGQQRDRLERLTAQERAARFAAFGKVAFYLGIFVLIIIAERFVRRKLLTRIRDRNRRYFVVKIFTGTVYSIIAAWILYRLSGDYPEFITSFAIVGAGIAVALQAIIKDIVGWILIVQKRLFRIGQRVTIGPFTGDVADITLLRTALVEVNNSVHADIGRAGQTLYIPNSLVLEGPVLNYHATSDFMEAEIPVTVSYNSDWKQAEEILRAILKEEVGEFVDRARVQHAHRTAHFFATQEPPEPRVFVELAADGVFFLLRFQIPIGSRRSAVSSIAKKILERFASAKPPVALAYKTVQVLQS